MKYTAINLGPVVPTISMARKPREIWAASYLFSFIMETIIEKLKETNGITIISPAPAVEGKTLRKDVGLFPDRVFFEDTTSDNHAIQDIINTAISEVSSTCHIPEKISLKAYINIMYVSIENSESPIKDLNLLLDKTELFNRPSDDEARNEILTLIQKRKDSPLYVRTGAKDNTMEVLPFAEIATHRLKLIDEDRWQLRANQARLNEEELAKKRKESNKSDEEIQEDYFYQLIKQAFPKKGNEDKNNKEDKFLSFFSHDKYICVVQADGDNMGKIVSSLSTDKVAELSQELLSYGSDACDLIKNYGGLPIYAGGDDLLFIAPVVSGIKHEDHTIERKTIFDLIDQIDKRYEDVNTKAQELDAQWNTYISYGLSISYYKYPLYEALKAAIDLLFEKAKNIPNKNAVSWCLRKHSGSGFKGECTKFKATGDAKPSIYDIFRALMQKEADNSLVAAIAHKLKVNEDILEVLRKTNDANRDQRLRAFYKTTLEEPKESNSKHIDTVEDLSTLPYIGLTRELLAALINHYNSIEEESQATATTSTQEHEPEKEAEEKQTITQQLLEQMYGMLRTAKFINGEEDNDEQ